MRRLLLLPLLLVCPWRLAGRLGAGRGFRWIGPHLVVGLTLVPALFGALWLAQRIQLAAEAAELPAPQAGLMAELADGIVQSQVGPPARLAAFAAGWVAGGLAAGILGCVMLSLLLLGLAGKQALAQRPLLWSVGAWATGFLPIALAGVALWVQIHTEGKLGGEPAALLIALGVGIPVWATAGAGALAWGALRGPCGQSPWRAATNAALFGFLLWFVVLFVAQLAGLLTWLPMAILDRY